MLRFLLDRARIEEGVLSRRVRATSRASAMSRARRGKRGSATVEKIVTTGAVGLAAMGGMSAFGSTASQKAVCLGEQLMGAQGDHCGAQAADLRELTIQGPSSEPTSKQSELTPPDPEAPGAASYLAIDNRSACSIRFSTFLPPFTGPRSKCNDFVRMQNATTFPDHWEIGQNGSVDVAFNTSAQSADVPVVVKGMTVPGDNKSAPFSLELDGKVVVPRAELGNPGVSSNAVMIITGVKQGAHHLVLRSLSGPGDGSIQLDSIYHAENSLKDLVADAQKSFPQCPAPRGRMLLADGNEFKFIYNGETKTFARYGRFVNELRSHFESGTSGDFFIQFTVGGVSTPYLRINARTLYITALSADYSPGHTHGHWRNLTPDQERYGWNQVVKIDKNALANAAKNAMSFARGASVAKDNLSAMLASLAFFTSEAARFNPVRDANDGLLKGRVDSVPWNTWKPVLNNWEGMSRAIVSADGASSSSGSNGASSSGGNNGGSSSQAVVSRGSLRVGLLTRQVTQWLKANGYDIPWQKQPEGCNDGNPPESCETSTAPRAARRARRA